LDDVPLGTLLGSLLILVLCSAFFSGTETALMCVNRYRLRHLAHTGHRGARFAEKLLQRPDRLIGVILFGNNLVNNAAAALVAVIALRLGGPAGVAIGTVAITIFMLVFAEVMPKTFAATKPERLALPAAYVYHGILRFLLPIGWIVRLITMFSNALLRLVGVRPEQGADQSLTIDELRTIVAESSAMLPRKRQEIVMRVLELGTITVEDIMIPQSEVVGIDLNDDWQNIIGTIQNSGYTRLPVYREAIDNVVGLLHVKRLVRHFDPARLTKATIEELVDEPYFVPEGTPLNKQLVQFQRNRQRTAFVVDEYGDIQGIVTLEDLLEEIVGDFTSEPAEEQAAVRREEGSGAFVVDASTNLRVLNRTMNWRLPTDGPKTLNGLILAKLGAIPQKGTRLMLDDYAVEILRTTDNTVESVRIREPSQIEPRLAAGA
jgi:Mg2+/Co2+ transporter CorB